MIDAIGAWIVCFPCASTVNGMAQMRETLRTIKAIIDYHAATSYSLTKPLLLAVVATKSEAPSLEVRSEEWEDLCRDEGGWEWIDGSIGVLEGGQKGQEKATVNEFREKVGMDRLEEALEANEWEGGGEVGLSLDEEGTVDGDHAEGL